MLSEGCPRQKQGIRTDQHGRWGLVIKKKLQVSKSMSMEAAAAFQAILRVSDGCQRPWAGAPAVLHRAMVNR